MHNWQSSTNMLGSKVDQYHDKPYKQQQQEHSDTAIRTRSKMFKQLFKLGIFLVKVLINFIDLDSGFLLPFINFVNTIIHSFCFDS